MSLNLPSNRKEFASFPKLYEENIAPYLAGKESLRQETVRKVIIVGCIMAVATLMIVIFGPAKLRFFVGFLGLAGIIGTSSMILEKARHEITVGLIGKLTDQLGFSYARKIKRPAYFEMFDELRFFNMFNREHWEDEVRGIHNGQNFVICESHLRYRKGGKNSSTRTIFHGQMLVIDYPKQFFGQTVLRRDSGIMNRFTRPGKDFQQVGIASPKFEEIYEAWSTDQVEARDILDPLVLERFEELERMFEGKSLKAAFTHGKLIIAISNGDRLNIGSMFKPLRGKERVEKILCELDAIFDLMDVAIKSVDHRFDGALSVQQMRA